MKRRVVIGDIHGRWELFNTIYNRENPDIVICLGDYLDSFDISSNEQYECLNKLISIRNEHEQIHGNDTFIMLMGNHDYHYIYDTEQYSGKSQETKVLCKPILHKMIDEHILKRCFVDHVNKTIYSHAGVSNTWMNDWKVNSLDEINTIQLDSFIFTYGDSFSPYGDTKYASPIWIRPWSLGHDMWKDENDEIWRQVVGHTECKDGIVDFNIVKFTNHIEHIPLILCDAITKQYMVEHLDYNGNIIDVEYKNI